MMMFSTFFAIGNVAPEIGEAYVPKESAIFGDAAAITNIAQQRVQISGRVVDQDGFLLPGVAIEVKERRGVGVATDVDGNYTIEVGSKETLIFSYIGYETAEYEAGKINGVTIVLQEETTTLEEVTVVAFGTQKKESVVSSITTVRPSELRAPVSNLTSALAGKMAGVIAYQRSGEPGLDNAEFFIRGITTFSSAGKKDPLILIDGIEMSSTDLARVNVDDISSFTLMKDANAAALYGARGANGVILVTTKEGSVDRISVNIRGEMSRSSNTELVELADPITYMRLHNEAVKTRDPMAEIPYTSNKIRETALGIDPVINPSVDWYDYLIKDHASNKRINMNITGGGKAVQYYLAANWQNDTGILKESKENMFDNNINVNRLQVRSNVTIKFSPATTAVVRAYGTFDETTGPSAGGSSVFSSARNASPVMFLPFYPPDEERMGAKHILFGRDSEMSFNNPYASIMSAYRKTSASMMLLQLELEHKFTGKLAGLYLKGLYNVKRDSSYTITRSYNPFYYSIAATADGSYMLNPLNPDSGTEYLTFSLGNRNILSAQYGEMRLGFNREYNKVHDVNVLFVGSMRDESSTSTSSQISDQLQATLPLRNLSLAGRVAYGFDSRYFLEFNFGINGSERFAKENRFGFFPSVGGGWMVSNEEFMKPLKKVISTLKLKATYGLVGNDQIGSSYDRFFYLSQIDMSGSGWTFGSGYGSNRNYRSGITIDRYANDKITWEIAEKTNFGIELGLFKDLTIIADYFTETRSNILQTRADIPTTVGLRTTPQANVGVAQGKGFEFELKYQKHFTKDLWTIANTNFTYATSRYKKYEEPDWSDVPWKSRVGQKISQPTGYIAERLFIDEVDVNNSPKQEIGGTYGAGDIKYKDINGDGKINSEDMVPIGFPTTPEIIYGSGLSTGYKQFDFSFFFQGSARSSFFISSTDIAPFISKGQRGLLQYIADDHWSETNRNIYAFWPRLSETQRANNNANSTHWLRNGAFVRLKTAEFGYSVPDRLTKKIYLTMFRVYVSGSNLFHWSAFKMWDPEMAGNGLGYPLQRVFNLGVNINF